MSVREAVLAVAEGQINGRIFASPDIPHKKLANARKGFITRADEVFLLVDDTVFGSGKDGLAITEKYIYAKQLFEIPKSIKISSIRSLEYESKRVNLDIYINDNLFLTLSSLERHDHDYLMAILQAAKEAATEGSLEPNQQEENPDIVEQDESSQLSCDECNAELPPNAKFCLECGAKVLPKGVCLACDVKLPENAKFCPECGTPAGKQSEATAPTAAATGPQIDTDQARNELSELLANAEQDVSIDSDGDLRIYFTTRGMPSLASNLRASAMSYSIKVVSEGEVAEDDSLSVNFGSDNDSISLGGPYLRVGKLPSAQYEAQIDASLWATTTVEIHEVELKAGKIDAPALGSSRISVSSLKATKDDSDGSYGVEYELKAYPNHYVHFEILSEKPEEDVNLWPNLDSDESRSGTSWLYDVEPGATIYVVFAEYEKIIDGITATLSGTAEPMEGAYDEADDAHAQSSGGSRQLIYGNMDWWDVAEQPPGFEDLPSEFAEAFKLWNLDAEHNHQRLCDLLQPYIYALFVTENFDDWSDLFSHEHGAEYLHSEIRLVGVDFCQAPLPRVKTEALFEVVCAVSSEAVEKSLEDQGRLLADGISFGWELPEDDGEIDLTFGDHQGVEAHFTDDNSLESTNSKGDGSGGMASGDDTGANAVNLQFQIKRGIVAQSDFDEDDCGDLKNCWNLCREGKHEEAVALLMPHLSFEWDWSNGDGDASDYFVDPSSINQQCTEENCSLQIGDEGDTLALTATVSFSVRGRPGIDEDELSAWLDDNSMYACGFVSGGWGYDGSDGDNVWVAGIVPAGADRPTGSDSEGGIEYRHAADRAFNIFFNAIRKGEDTDTAAEWFRGEIAEQTEAAGISYDYGWEQEITPAELQIISETVANRLKGLNEAQGYEVSSDFYQGFIASFSNIIYNRSQEGGGDFDTLQQYWDHKICNELPEECGTRLPNPHDIEIFIQGADDGSVSAVIVYRAMEDGSGGYVIRGAYYGYCGGGVNDGGYFVIDHENGDLRALDYSDVDEIEADNPELDRVYSALMQQVWTLISEDDDVLELSPAGVGLIAASPESGCYMSSDFDGDALDEVSKLWKMTQKFES